MDLEAFEILVPDLPIVFCGINPTVQAAATGHNFGSASNRFWRALHQSGLTDRQLRAQDDRLILQYGLGLTAAVVRGTRTAAELTSADLRDAVEPLRRRIEHFRPRIVAFLGRPAFAAITGRARFEWGRQAEDFAGAGVWVLPNPSGLNRAFPLERMVRAYSDLRTAAAPDLRVWLQSRHTTRRKNDEK
jgi:TDG/mug DNA glycosylase family protein